MTSESGNRIGRFAPALSGKGLLAVVVWGASFVATRLALRSFDPFGLIAVRLVTGTVLLGLLVRWRYGRLLPDRADAARCVLLGCVLGVHLLIQAYGLERTSAINTGWIIGFIPITIALGAHLLGRQRVSRTGWFGIAVGAAGVVVVTASAPPDFERARLGDLLQITSCLTWAVYTLAGAAPVGRSGAPRVTLLAMASGAVLVTVPTAWTGVTRQALTVDTVCAAAFLGLICTGVAYFLWYQALHERGPAHIGALLYLEPFVTLATAAAVLKERVTANALVGGMFVLAGVWLVSRGIPRPVPQPRSASPGGNG